MSTHNIPFQYNNEITINFHKATSIFFLFSKGLKNELETAMVNEPSVFEPLKVYSIA